MTFEDWIILTSYKIVMYEVLNKMSALNTSCKDSEFVEVKVFLSLITIFDKWKIL